MNNSDYKNLKDIDLKLLLLAGYSVDLGNLSIIPYKIKEITKITYSKYMSNLQCLLVTVEDFISSIEDEEERKAFEKDSENFSVFDFYISTGNKALTNRLIESLAMVFRTDDIFLFNNEFIALNFVKKGIITLDENKEIKSINSSLLNELKEDELEVIHRDNFDKIVEIVKFQNYLKTPEIEKEENPADESTKALMEQMKEYRKKLERAKRVNNEMNEEEEGIDLYDIISSVSTKSNSLNKLNIFDLTLYQLYDEYSRLELIDNYNFSLKAMIAGATDVETKHWSSKI